MKLIKPSVEIIEQPSGIEGLFKHIELCGRTCYKSQDKITEDSAKRFVEGLIKSGHGSVLEHGTVYLYAPSKEVDVDDDGYVIFENALKHYANNKYSKYLCGYVTTNYRVLVENGWLDDLKYLCEPTKYHKKRITVRFNCDIGVSREANRHRVNSVSEQSTRYCNYTKEKFGGGLNIILNNDITDIDVYECADAWDCYREDGSINEDMLFRKICHEIGSKWDNPFGIVDTWLFANLAAQWSYSRLIKLGWKPQQARRVLPLDTASELIHTAFISDWKHFLSLRSPKYDATGVHPDMAYLADNLYEQIKHLL